MARLILTGDVNLMNVTDPVTPFRRVAEEFRAADMVFSNLECCLYAPSRTHSFHNEGFYADPAIGAEALRKAAIAAVGIANNVNYGEAAILASIARLDALGIPHTGAGADVTAARAPVIVERAGLRFGFLQRSSVYWPTNHEAGPHDPGIAVIRAHTAYQVPMHKTRPEIPPLNRPGIPPVIITWTDPDYLRAFTEDVGALRARADFVVASCHWGLHKEVMAYMREIAHAAIDAGADLVIGHHPHVLQGAQIYKGHFIVYSLGDLVFDHYDLATGQTVLVHAVLSPHGVKVTLIPVYVSLNGIPAIVTGAPGRAILLHMQRLSAALGTRLTIAGDRAYVRSASR